MSKPTPTKRLLLRPHEAAELARVGRVEIRRLIAFQFKHEPNGVRGAKWYIRDRRTLWHSYETLDELIERRCPLGPVGGRLWGAEAWLAESEDGTRQFRICVPDKPGSWLGCGVIHPVYAADGPRNYKGRPAIWWQAVHMPRWASRFPNLTPTAITVERGAGGWEWVARIEDLRSREGGIDANR